MVRLAINIKTINRNLGLWDGFHQYNVFQKIKIEVDHVIITTLSLTATLSIKMTLYSSSAVQIMLLQLFLIVLTKKLRQICVDGSTMYHLISKSILKLLQAAKEKFEKRKKYTWCTLYTSS